MNFYIIVRAFRNIKRIPGRSILTGGILLIIITMVLVGLTVNAGTKISIQQARKSLGNKAVLQASIEGVQQKSGDKISSAVSTLADLTDSTAAKLINSDLIEDYDYIIYAFVLSGIKNLKVDGAATGGSFSAGGADMSKIAFRLVGNTSLERMEDFKSGTKKLLEGRGYTQQEIEESANVAVIDKRIAALNNLKVGSEFEVTLNRKDGAKANPVMLKVIGIYEDYGKDENVFSGMDMYLRGNVIHLPYSAVQNIVSEDNYRPAGFLSSAYYFLKDPLDINNLRDEAARVGIDMNSYNLELADSSFTKITAPMNKLSEFSKTGVIAIMITGAFIMALLMTIIIRERKAEVGILRALGASRVTIAVQFAIETLILCSIAIVLGLGIGSNISQAVADQFLQKEITANEQQDVQNNVMKSFDDILNPNSQAAVIDNVHVELSSLQIIQVTLAGILICICGSISSIYWIMKYEPMKMLANRT